MRKVAANVCVLLLGIILTGCPYRETYIYTGSPIVAEDIVIKPIKVYFKEGKKYMKCSTLFLFTNKSAKEKIIDFKNAYLSNTLDTIRIKNVIYTMGNPISPTIPLILPPMRDTMISLHFESDHKLKNENLHLLFQDSELGNVTIKYNRTDK